MNLSITLVIVLSVVIPALCLAIAFSLFMLYRLSRIRGRIFHHETGLVRLPPPIDAHDHSRCDDCCEKHERAPPSPLITARRGSSISQPHFAETSTRIRRVSSKGDTIQRVNSVTSTLLTAAQPSSEVLPFGGRRGSAGDAMDYASLSAPKPGQISMGNRRPSALSDPDSGMINVRRVSVGGGEDVVVVRSGSQSSEARRQSIANAAVANKMLDEIDALPSPTLPRSHPFATAGSSSVSYGPTQPLQLGQPKKKGTSKGAQARPDSLTLSKARQVAASSQAQSCNIVSTDSVEALRSPRDSWSPDTPAAEIFEAWRGFRGTSATVQTRSVTAEQPLSPRTPIPAAIQKEEATLILVPAEPSPRVDSANVSPFVPSEVDAYEAHSTSPVSNTPTEHSDVILSGEGSIPSRKGSRITLLADVVRENEERRKLDREEASSTVGLASVAEPRRLSS